MIQVKKKGREDGNIFVEPTNREAGMNVLFIICTNDGETIYKEVLLSWRKR